MQKAVLNRMHSHRGDCKIDPTAFTPPAHGAFV